MVKGEVFIFGSNGCLLDMVPAIFGRICIGPIQTGSFTNGDREDYRIMSQNLPQSVVSQENIIVKYVQAKYFGMILAF